MFAASPVVSPLIVSVKPDVNPIKKLQPAILNLASVMRWDSSIFNEIRKTPPQAGAPALPTAEASVTSPTFLGLLKCSPMGSKLNTMSKSAGSQASRSARFKKYRKTQSRLVALYSFVKINGSAVIFWVMQNLVLVLLLCATSV
jgi:hypothetical protein